MSPGPDMRQRVLSVVRAVPSSDPDPGPADGAVDVADLYRAHERTVMRWAARLGGPDVDVEDVVQDVFLIAKRRLTWFEGPGSVRTWLFRTTEKVVLAARRKNRLRRWLARSAEVAVASMGAPGPTPGEAIERDREIRDVYRVLDRLPERQRRILVLFELDGLSTQEIADLIGVRAATVRVRLFRARARFMQEHQRLFGGAK